MATIKLLDGKIYDTAALLKKMQNDEFYYGELDKLALSSSSLKTLLASPKTYKFVKKYGNAESQALRDGWLFHTAILEPDVFAAIGEVLGKPFRGKADVLASDRIVDLKTTSDIKGFHYAAKKYGYDIQCYLYCNLFGKDYQDFKFLVLDKGSLDIGIWDCSKEFYYAGEEKVQKAIDLYDKFFVDGADIDNYCLSGTL